MKEFLLFMIMWFTFANHYLQADYQDIIPEQLVFKACLDKASILNDSTICACAEFVGHPKWCEGDIKY